MPSDSESEIPDANTCQKLVEDFAAITGTDEACAQFFLQDRDWNLERSVNAFFQAQEGGGGVSVLNDGDVPELLISVDSKMKEMMEKATTTKPPDKFRLITWNVDGLDEKNLKKRTKAVLKNIELLKPDFVFLQELIPETYSYLEKHLVQYMGIPTDNSDYFTAAFIHQTKVYFDGHRIVPFENTTMNRNVLVIDAHIGKVKLQLLNTHLESTKDFAKARTEQFKKCIDIMKKGNNVTNILAGDLNIRDNEVESANVPPSIQDLWIKCGRRKECEFTWDLKRNTNKQFPSRFQPRCRFDRVYFKPDSDTVTPVFFGLVGIEKVTGTESFPSDHWGLMVDFEINNTTTTDSASSTSSSKRKNSIIEID